MNIISKNELEIKINNKEFIPVNFALPTRNSQISILYKNSNNKSFDNIYWNSEIGFIAFNGLKYNIWTNIQSWKYFNDELNIIENYKILTLLYYD